MSRLVFNDINKKNYIMTSIKLLYTLLYTFLCVYLNAQSPEVIKKNLYQAYESLNKRDFATFKSLCTTDFVDYTAGPLPVKGIDAAIESYKAYFELAPDLQIKINSVTINGNKIFLETMTTGTNTGKVFGMLPPTGKKIKINDIETVTIDANAKATSHTVNNPNELLVQIGYASFTNPNTQKVMALYQLFGKADALGIAAMCAANVEWDIRDNPVLRNPRLIKSSKDVPSFFAELMELCEVTKFEPVRFAADGDEVFTAVKVQWKNKSGGKELASDFMHHFTFNAEGKVAAFKELTSKPVDDWE